MSSSAISISQEYGSSPRIIVCVDFPGNVGPVDLEVPSHISSSQLSKLLIQAIDPEMGENFSIVAESHGITLTQEQSLAEAEVWDGALLTLRPIQGSAILTVKSSGTQYQLLYAEIFIGRSPQIPANHLQSSVIDLSREIDSQTISRVHACIHHQNGNWTIEGLPQARNPIWIDNIEIAPSVQTHLHTGNSIRLGDVEMIFTESI